MPLDPKGPPRGLFPDTKFSEYNADITEGGTRPLWSRSGRELFFLNAAHRMAVVAVQPGSSFTYAKAQLLFDATNYTYAGNPFRYFDISADGKRFLMIKFEAASATGTTRPSIVVVSNWFEELKSRTHARQ